MAQTVKCGIPHAAPSGLTPPAAAITTATSSSGISCMGHPEFGLHSMTAIAIAIHNPKSTIQNSSLLDHSQIDHHAVVAVVVHVQGILVDEREHHAIGTGVVGVVDVAEARPGVPIVAKLL